MLYIIGTTLERFKYKEDISGFMAHKDLLLDIGLTNNEAEVYLILLTLNEALASEIAGKTKISRPHVYDSLNKLIAKGMSAYVIKSGKKYFKPTDPIKILEYIKERELELKQKQKVIEQVLPELKALFQPLKEKPKVEIYEGVEGIKTILDNIIRTGKELLSFNTLGKEFLEYLPEHIIKRYLNERKKNKIKSRQFYVKGAKIIRHFMARYKEIPREFSQVTLFVYGNNVVMFILIKYPLTIKIESKEVAKLYKDQFEFMWEKIR